MMKNEDFSASLHSEKTETGLLGAISAKFYYGIMYSRTVSRRTVLLSV